MQEASEPIARVTQQFAEYLPTFAAGAFLVVLGLVIGWLAKRSLVRILTWLRLDRLGQRAGWHAAFAKADVRAPLYEMIGNSAGILVALIFVDNALQIWGLTVLAQMVERVIFYVPNLLLAAVVVGIGFLVAGTVATRIERTLEEEGAPRPRLVAKVLQSTLMTVVSALALWQLNFAREIVYAAFLIGFGAVGVAFALAVGIGTARAIQHGWLTLFDKRLPPDQAESGKSKR